MKITSLYNKSFNQTTNSTNMKNTDNRNKAATNRAKANDNKAHIYNLIIVDESGSMCHLRESTLAGINETINTIRKAQEEFAETQTHTLTIVTFDSGTKQQDVRAVILNEPIAEVTEFKNYMPAGGTPLYDAMGESLTVLHNRIKDDNNATAVVTVLTDGEENSSTKWNIDRLRHLIEQLKSEGWSFSYMGSCHDVKQVTISLSIENVIEFSHDNTGVANTWGREQSSRHEYFRKMDRMYSEKESMSREEMQQLKRQYAQEYYSSRVSNDRIDHLEENEIFVFGSNTYGHHSGGAAATAMRRFGAVWGQGEGLQGRSYAIPTMEGIESLSEAIARFTRFATQHPELRFLVTRIGCGIAGYTASRIAPLFKDCIKLENVALPADFWKVLGLKMH